MNNFQRKLLKVVIILIVQLVVITDFNGVNSSDSENSNGDKYMVFFEDFEEDPFESKISLKRYYM